MKNIAHAQLVWQARAYVEMQAVLQSSLNNKRYHTE
jgi:hypothetical protein